MVVGEIPEFFQFPKHEFSTARCKCTIYIITYIGIKVVIRSLTFHVGFFFFQLFFFYLKLNSIIFLKEIVLVMRNCCITMSEIEL